MEGCLRVGAVSREVYIGEKGVENGTMNSPIGEECGKRSLFYHLCIDIPICDSGGIL